MQRTIRSIALVVSLAVPGMLLGQSTYAANGTTDPAYGNGNGGQTMPVGEHSRFDMNHVDVGVFADYFRFAPPGYTANYVGAGGRIAFSVQPNIALEAEMSYDFARNFTTKTTTGSGTTVTTTFTTSNVRPITGLFGPKFQFGTSGPFRVFATGKVGFVDFSTSSSSTVTGSQFSSGVAGIGGSGTYFAAYPGGGFEAFLGPVGLRVEGGDEIYLNNGVYNNLRVTFGPTFRF